MLSNYTENVEVASVSIPGDLILVGFSVYSDNASSQYVQVFDTGRGVPSDGSVPAATFSVAANSPLGVYYGEAGRRCRNGVTICNSSTAATKTIGSADCLFDVQYAPIED